MNKKQLAEYINHLKLTVERIETDSGFASGYKMLTGLLNDAVNKVQQGFEIDQSLIDLIIEKLKTLEKNCPYNLIKNQKENLINILKILGFDKEVEKLLKD